MTTAKVEGPEVYKAISAVMATMAKEGISKDRRNQQQGYNFRGIDDVYNALGKVLAENSLVIIPRVIAKEREERKTSKGGLLMYTILTVEFDLVSAKDGSKALACTIGEAMDMADKSANKAQSAALKYAAMQIFMIPTEGDNDADAQTHDVAAAETVQCISPAQEIELIDLAREVGADQAKFLKWCNVPSFAAIPAVNYTDARNALEAKRKATGTPELGDDQIPYQ